MNTCNTKKIASRGFTLIESLVAIFIFSLSIVGLMTITSKGIAGTNAAVSQVTGQFLAQEGVEVARSMRDDELIVTNGSSFAKKLVDVCERGCMVDSTGPRPELVAQSNVCNFGNANLCPVYINTSGRFNDGSGQDATQFYRKINVRLLPSAPPYDGVYIVSSVGWRQGGIDRVIELDTIVTNWLTTRQ